jgi:hypothetical protein
MRRVIFLFTLVLCASSLSAQSTLDTLRFADLKWSLQKKAVVLNYMNFTEAEKASFWPVFDSYNAATRFVELESLMLLKKFSDANGDVSTQELEEISRRMLHNDLQLAKIRKQFYKRFKDAVSSKQATAFFQIDTMFRSMMRLEAQRYFASSQMMELARNK